MLGKFSINFQANVTRFIYTCFYKSTITLTVLILSQLPNVVLNSKALSVLQNISMFDNHMGIKIILLGIISIVWIVWTSTSRWVLTQTTMRRRGVSSWAGSRLRVMVSYHVPSAIEDRSLAACAAKGGSWHFLSGLPIKIKTSLCEHERSFVVFP